MPRLVRTLLFFAVVYAGAFQLAADEPDLAPLKEWLAFQRGVRTVEADFVQIRELRTLRKGLRSEGTVWIDYGGKRFRWQTGAAAAPKTVAVKNGDILTLIQPGRKRAERVGLGEARGGEHGPAAAFDFATGELPATLDELRRSFDILEVTAQGDLWRARLRPIAGGLRESPREVAFLIDAKGHHLRGFEITFSDGSVVKTTLTRQRLNGSLDDALFAPDLTGYTIKEG